LERLGGGKVQKVLKLAKHSVKQRKPTVNGGRGGGMPHLPSP